MAELCLIGWLPQDPDGLQRLLAVLETLQPDALAVDDTAPTSTPTADSDQALAVIATHLEDSRQLAFWRTRLAPEQVHYAAVACVAYSGQHDIPVHFVGDNTESNSADDAAGLLELDAETLRGMATFDWQHVYAQEYARARRDLETRGCIEFVMPLEQHRAFHERECALVAQIEQLLVNPGTQRLALVCGVPHLYFSESDLTLYMQLGQGTARRFLADGAGEIRDELNV